MSESELFVPTTLTVEEVQKEFQKALWQMEYLHLRAVINQMTAQYFPDDKWQAETGNACMAELVALRDETLRKMRGE